MTDPRWDDLSDELLSGLLPEAPPEDVVRTVNPWSGALTRIVWGMALVSITLSFLGLDLLLPALGWLLICLGLRPLRRENRWLTMSWAVSLIHLIYNLTAAVLSAWVWGEVVYQTAAFRLVWAAMLPAQLLADLGLWLGLRAVRKRAGLAPGAWSALALLIWHALILALALLKTGDRFILFSILLLALYAAILVSLHRLSKALDQAGYVVTPAPARLSQPILAALVAGLTALGILLGICFGQRYPMDWMADTDVLSPQAQAIQAQLVELGAPAEVLDDLTEHDLLALAGASRVITGTEDHPMNEGVPRVETEPDGTRLYTTDYPVKELRLTGLAVELPGHRWQLIHHFTWVEEPTFFGTESIQLYPAWALHQGWAQAGELSGRLLCQQGGVTLTAPYYDLADRVYTSTDFFGNEMERRDVFALFSLPRHAQNTRGYLSYGIQELEPGWIVDGWFNYTHQCSPIQYPVKSAAVSWLTDPWNLSHTFRTVQTAIQFFPQRDGDTLHGCETDG